MSFACRVMRIGIVAGQPDLIHAALEVGGTMRSLDGGETWSDGSADLEKLAADNVNLKSMLQSDSEAEGMLDAHALAVSSAAPSSVFLAVRMGLFRSDDRGKSWQRHGDRPVLAAHVRPRHPRVAARPAHALRRAEPGGPQQGRLALSQHRSRRHVVAASITA